MPYICLHKSEWSRLKAQADPPLAPRKEENKYIKDLIEQSQKWIKSWPDSYEGQIKLLQRQAKKDHKQEAGAYAVIRKQKQYADTRQAMALAKARQLIFEGSCYGKQLLSALLASKVIEEREAQIALKKEIAEKEEEQEKKRYKNELYFCKADQEEQRRLRKNKNVVFAKDNKCINEELNAKLKKEKMEEERWQREDARLMLCLLDKEKQDEEELKKCKEDQIRNHNKEQQEYREAKLKRDIENDAIIEKAKKEHEQKLMKMRETQKKITLDKKRSDAIEKNYKILENIEIEKRKRFEEVTEKRDKLNEDVAIKKEQEDEVKHNRRRETKKLLSEQYKAAMEEAIARNKKPITCDRQSLFVKSRCKITINKKKQQKSQIDPKSSDHKLQFLFQSKKLIEELRQREKVPSPWTGTSGAHAHFAVTADRVLAEATHKTMARRVVDDYRRINRLDATTLPVKNY